jgi:exopolyphosphatase / guanosine-5'-triphosphate,3'-diphosphate pyrophosphatase
VGEPATVIAQVEIGAADVPHEMELTREAAEDVFRTVVTEARSDRADNPGLPPDHVDTVMASACVMVALMRRFHLDSVVIERGR